jgi:hypothetical protein
VINITDLLILARNNDGAGQTFSLGNFDDDTTTSSLTSPTCSSSLSATASC